MAIESLWEEISSCRICASGSLRDVLDLGNQPPANSLYQPGEVPPSPIPLRLKFCETCSCLQLAVSVDPHHLFRRYLWVTGTSQTARKYSTEFAIKALSKRVSDKKKSVIEIASNDGTFLRAFQKLGHEVLGIDPAQNIAEQACLDGIDTKISFFNEDCATEILAEKGPADIIFARNVIPHVKEIHSVISGINILMTDDSLGIIEFHDSSLLLKEIQYDYIYHEHLFYFTIASLQYLLNMHKLYIFDVGRSLISGGSWVVYFSKKQQNKSSRLLDAYKKEKAIGVSLLSEWRKFSKNAISHKSKLVSIVKQSQAPIMAYGASARSSTMLNFSGLNSNSISCIIDKNPLKRNLLTPGTGIPVISLNEGFAKLKEQDLVLLLAWNFTEEITEELRSLGYKGRFIRPLPNDPVII